jgi:hypothetical protein
MYAQLDATLDFTLSIPPHRRYFFFLCSLLGTREGCLLMTLFSRFCSTKDKAENNEDERGASKQIVVKRAVIAKHEAKTVKTKDI